MSGDEQHLPWIERLLREAETSGEFSGLKGSGKPIGDLDRYYEAGWWARRFVERERANEAVIELASRLREDLPRIMAQRDETAVRSLLDRHNEEIAQLNERLPEEERVSELDVDLLLAERRKRHS